MKPCADNPAILRERCYIFGPAQVWTILLSFRSGVSDTPVYLPDDSQIHQFAGRSLSQTPFKSLILLRTVDYFSNLLSLNTGIRELYLQNHLVKLTLKVRNRITSRSIRAVGALWPKSCPVGADKTQYLANSGDPGPTGHQEKINLLADRPQR